MAPPSAPFEYRFLLLLRPSSFTESPPPPLLFHRVPLLPDLLPPKPLSPPPPPPPSPRPNPPQPSPPRPSPPLSSPSPAPAALTLAQAAAALAGPQSPAQAAAASPAPSPPPRPPSPPRRLLPILPTSSRRAGIWKASTRHNRCSPPTSRWTIPSSAGRVHRRWHDAHGDLTLVEVQVQVPERPRSTVPSLRGSTTKGASGTTGSTSQISSVSSSTTSAGRILPRPTLPPPSLLHLLPILFRFPSRHPRHLLRATPSTSSFAHHPGAHVRRRCPGPGVGRVHISKLHTGTRRCNRLAFRSDQPLRLARSHRRRRPRPGLARPRDHRSLRHPPLPSCPLAS